jgi:hypothetical protein
VQVHTSHLRGMSEEGEPRAEDPAPPSFKHRGFVAGTLAGQGSYGRVFNVRLAARFTPTMVLKRCEWTKPADVYIPMADVTEIATMVHLQRDLRVPVAPVLRDVWVGQGVTCLTMDKGVCLHTARAECCQDEAVAVATARGFLHCLCLMHAAGVAHQDIKAGNAVTRVEGSPGPAPRVRLVDFGAASTAVLGCLGTGVFGTGCALPPEALVADAGVWVDPFPGDVWAAARVVLSLFLGPVHRRALPFLRDMPQETSWQAYALRVWRTFGVPQPPSELCRGRLFGDVAEWPDVPRKSLKHALAEAAVGHLVPLEVQTLLEGMLVLEPSGRTTCAQLATHDFLAPCGTAAAVAHVTDVVVPQVAAALHVGGATEVCPVRRARAFGALVAAGRKAAPRRVSSARVFGGGGGGGGGGVGGAGVAAAPVAAPLDGTALVLVLALPVLQAYLRRETTEVALEWAPASVAGAVFALCASFLHIKVAHAVAPEDAAQSPRILNTIANGMPSLTAAGNHGLPVKVLQRVGQAGPVPVPGPVAAPGPRPDRTRDLDCLLCMDVWPSSTGLTRAQTLAVVEVVADWYLHAQCTTLDQDVAEVAAAALETLADRPRPPWRTPPPPQ